MRYQNFYFGNQNSNFLTLQTVEFKKKMTGIFRIENRIGIPLTMGVLDLEPKIGIPNQVLHQFLFY
jgi:hypothetical protein